MCKPIFESKIKFYAVVHALNMPRVQTLRSLLCDMDLRIMLSLSPSRKLQRTCSMSYQLLRHCKSNQHTTLRLFFQA